VALYNRLTGIFLGNSLSVGSLYITLKLFWLSF
jgi:hypothetical protein